MIKSKIFQMCTGLALVGGLSACGDDAANNIIQEPDLNGRYQGTCKALGSSGLGLSYRESLVFEASDKFQRAQDFYTNGDCSPASQVGTAWVEGSYRVDNDGAPQADGGAMRLELSKAYIEADSEVAVDALNLFGYCGRKDYKVAEKVEISEGSDDATCIVKDVPDTLYGVYREDDGKLFLNEGGVSLMAQSEEDRPANLNRDEPYIKQ